MNVPQVLSHFAALAPHYDALLCDVWGVVHNGLAAFPHACDALTRARARGITVVLITNAPRPSHVVARQLDKLQVPRAAYDAIVSSGDVTRRVIEQRRGQRLYHLGPARDRAMFADATLAPIDEADYVVCTGLENDEVETPQDYQGRLREMLNRRLFMVCANPDVVVERGSKLVHCAGAIADLYAAMGGEVLYAGKPYRPIYDLALAKIEEVAHRVPPRERVLAIGDSLRTDLKGAQSFGVDFLFVAAGIHAGELGGREKLDHAALADALAAFGAPPRAVMQELTW